MSEILSRRGLLVITQLFLPTKGGSAVWFDEVYARIGGREIHILTEAVPESEAHDRHHNNSVHRVSLKRHPWLRPESLAMYLKLLGRAITLLARNPVGAVHCGRVLPEGLVGWGVARLFRKPLVIYAHGEEITTWRQSTKFRAMQFTYRHADQVIANSQFTCDELLKLGVDPSRIVQISPGVDTARFRPGLATEDLRRQIDLQPGQQLVLAVGRLSRRKGFDQVLRSVARLVEGGMDLKVALIGIGEDRAYLEQIAAENGLTRRVNFLGHVPTSDLPRWYNLADVFAMPNREIDGDTEGFGIVFLEAAACGIPVIAGQAGGTGSAVVDGETGVRVDGNDPGAIEEGLARLLKDPALAQRLGEQAEVRVNREYAWDEVAHKTVALTLGLCSEHPLPTSK